MSCGRIAVLVAPSMVLFFSVNTVSAEQTAEQPQVFAILAESDPWRAAGLNSQATLYADGTVIVSKVQDDGSVSWSKGSVPPKSFAQVKESLGPTDAFRQLKGSYDLQPSGYDLPAVGIVLRDGTTTKSVYVRGLALDDHVPAGAYFGEQTQKPDVVPREFQRLLNILSTLELKNVEKWVPEYTEVVIYKVRDKRTLPLDWPEGWPKPHDPLSRCRGEGCSLIFSRDKLAAYERIDKKRAFAIDGRLWRISHSQPVVPGLEMWKRIADTQSGETEQERWRN